MKLKRNNERTTLSITKREWIRLGQNAGWDVPDEIDDDYAGLADPTLPILESSPAYDVEVEKYSERTWGVWLDGELLCVAVYKKGAMAVKDLIEDMAGRMQMIEGYIAEGK